MLCSSPRGRLCSCICHGLHMCGRLWLTLPTLLARRPWQCRTLGCRVVLPKTRLPFALIRPRPGNGVPCGFSISPALDHNIIIPPVALDHFHEWTKRIRPDLRAVVEQRALNSALRVASILDNCPGCHIRLSILAPVLSRRRCDTKIVLRCSGITPLLGRPYIAASIVGHPPPLRGSRP